MADKITLIEFHAHTDGSDFSVQPSLGSGVGALAKNALGGSTTTGSDDESESVVESLTSSDDEADDEEIEYSEEFDGDEADSDDDDDGAGKGTGLAGIIALIVLVLLTRKFLDDDEDPFEEEFGQ